MTASFRLDQSRLEQVAAGLPEHYPVADDTEEKTLHLHTGPRTSWWAPRPPVD